MSNYGIGYGNEPFDSGKDPLLPDMLRCVSDLCTISRHFSLLVLGRRFK